MANKNYAPKIPFQIENGNFVNISDILENIKQKMKMIILTNPGEKIMEPNFGVGIKKYLFENKKSKINEKFRNKIVSSETVDVSQQIKNEINNQVILFLPEVLLKNVSVQFEENIINVTINYTYRGFIQDQVDLAVTV
jgi:hypothetical protein